MIPRNLTPEQRKAEGIAFERFHSYRMGYHHGTRRGWRDSKFETHARVDLREAYAAGYRDGEEDNMRRMNAAMERYSYTPRILR